MPDPQIHAQTRSKPRLCVSLARASGEVREAQRLRYKVFAEEMGARLASREAGLDEDVFDAYCDHLLVRDNGSGEVIGTYRILPPHRARQIGGYYSEQEFDFTRLAHLRPGMVEIGRSCVHPDYRGGAVITLLWSGLADYLRARDYSYLIGCASVSMDDGGHTAASLYNTLAQTRLAPVEWHVFPRNPLALGQLDGSRQVAIPPLIKGYLRVGAYVCGEPAWDADFNTADLMLLLSIKQMNQLYARHFMSK
ncbi:hypothetical protein TPL01_01940 [Sulfuriferula plumbiphila]|uniref:L-ornithine N(alpha)-acyltransferase n=1 Tax=Sulfuriferula plumbiphila TaxID=171865 RepID=A0A512L3K2_9PROT|nr:GNAT family N-acetyltransferase [Sulfuriferula plumbiphila]BBP02762.1 hypothetical protein SFPGR_01840 [Sulfuriferula plumbiphila]GEP29056.1 hypothetical protein TPL01_01940 [Sulfuriferula plumbiphila]